LRGSEFNAPWRGGNPAEHLTIVPFTRMLAGPIDYTPGIFELDLSEYKKGAFVPTTLGYQLAEYVVIYGPMQMASDLPNNYAKNSRAFKFIKGVPTDWETSKVINGEIGEYLTIVRKDRHSDNWYLGSLTNNKRRNISLRFSFLSLNTKYVATIYADGPNAHWKRNPKILKISKYIVTSNTRWLLKLAKGGGQAISFVPADEESLKSLEEI
ncbi:MAG: glycoside hydrolase family 97 catalytic domain-containing protein, partial [Bacteroidetes bacterium]|nr:glycoside hydrolase family 97 catalytic domain-containing protein [Bacteroidota bacterium]